MSRGQERKREDSLKGRKGKLREEEQGFPDLLSIFPSFLPSTSPPSLSLLSLPLPPPFPPPCTVLDNPCIFNIAASSKAVNLFISIQSANESTRSGSTLAVSLHLLSTQLMQPHITPMLITQSAAPLPPKPGLSLSVSFLSVCKNSITEGLTYTI